MAAEAQGGPGMPQGPVSHDTEALADRGRLKDRCRMPRKPWRTAEASRTGVACRGSRGAYAADYQILMQNSPLEIDMNPES